MHTSEFQAKIDLLKKHLSERNPDFWPILSQATRTSSEFSEFLLLNTLRKKAHFAPVPGAPTSKPVRIALLSGYSMYPFQELLVHFLETRGIRAELFVGAYDNYVSEILDPNSEVYLFKPEITVLWPANRRCQYQGSLGDPRSQQRQSASEIARQLIDLTEKIHRETGSEVILNNFILPSGHDLGSYRTRTLGSDWSFRKLVNLEIGQLAPSYLSVCDLEFLSSRRGTLHSADARSWFESKQLGSPALLCDLAQETSHLIQSLRTPSKKVLVLDLDNTLWGGVIGDDGVDKIEVGGVSPRGEAFLAFQTYIRKLKDRGVLLAVCSKNDEARAQEPFLQHPDLALRLDDFVSFKANWEPKSENIRSMARELNLGLDSFVFVDDNLAEISIVNQFLPEVTTLHLNDDPSTYVSVLEDSRLFEPKSITVEDLQRTQQYLSEASRQALASSVTDMPAYLRSLEMEMQISPFTSGDVSRVSQLINKSNQFNLTTRRRSEAEVQALIGDPRFVTFSVRLKDRFGDHGLISVLIGQIKEKTLEIDSWLMSCRVLKRQVEDEIFNHIVRAARKMGCTTLSASYLPTAKNSMVKDLLPQFGFKLLDQKENAYIYELDAELAQLIPTFIGVRAEIP